MKEEVEFKEALDVKEFIMVEVIEDFIMEVDGVDVKVVDEAFVVVVISVVFVVIDDVVVICVVVVGGSLV